MPYKRKTTTSTTWICALCLLLLSLGAGACSGEGVSGIEGSIVDNENNANKLQQLLMVLNLTDADNKRIVVAGIDSVKLKVNGKLWGVFASEPLDTQGIETTQAGNFQVTDQEIGYLVIAAYAIESGTRQTAGDYVTYLNNRLRLPPGDYICEIAEVQFRDAANNTVTVKPRLYRPFTVTENIAALFLGEIDVAVGKN